VGHGTEGRLDSWHRVGAAGPAAVAERRAVVLWSQALLQACSYQTQFLCCEVEMLPGEWDRGQSSSGTVRR